MKGESWRNREVSSEGVSFKLRITNELAVTRWAVRISQHVLWLFPSWRGADTQWLEGSAL